MIDSNYEVWTVSCGQRLIAGSYSNLYRICYRTTLMAAMLLVSLPLVAIASEKPAPLMIDHALPAIEDGDLTSEVVELDGSAAKSLGIAQDHALLVVLSPKDRPAEKAGLKSGDVIFALNGQPAPNLDEFTAAVKRAGSGGEVSLGVWRQGERTTFQVRLGSTGGAMIPVGIEQEIEAYTAIGKIFGERGFPAIWGFIQCKLGGLYWIRVEGRSEDNIETAIAAYNSALTVLTREAFPQQWARTENDLALAYTDRVHGSRAENLEDAIRAYQAALTVLTRERSPREWAQIQNCLGLAYMERIEGNREDNVDAAIDSYETTLLVLDKEAFPQDWARLQKNLGQAYRARLRGERAENLKAAADADEAALTVLSQTIPTPPDAINPAPQEVSAKLESQQTEPKAIAKPAAAEGEPQPLVNEAKSSGQPAGAFKQAPGEENSTGLWQAAPIVAETVQTDPTQPADRLATKRDAQLQKLSAEQEDTMLKRAFTLLSQNDIAGARLILQYLANHGSVGGAFALGESYDPKKWASQRVIGMTPDEDLARSWYARAAEIGNREPAAILRKEKP